MKAKTKGKVHIKTFGCQSNYFDSERIAGVLQGAGFELVGSEKNADIVIVNSCGVKSVTQNRIVSYVHALPKNKKIFVGGCLPRMLDLRKVMPNVFGFFDVNTVSKLPLLIASGKKVCCFSNVKENKLKLSCVRSRKDVAMVTIAQGCLGNCSYCSTKLARGNLVSYSEGEIEREVRKAVHSGCKMIYLTSQDNGCYGKDNGSSLPKLLGRLVNIKGKFEIRVGMMNPEHALGFLDELVAVYKNKKIMRFLHIPVQSGSDKVLASMNRKYKIADFEKIVRRFRKEIPNINVSTDVIVGYPTEGAADFKKSVRLVKKLKPEILNINKFAPRPGTAVVKLKQLLSQEVKRRSVLLSEVFRSYKS